MGGKGSGGHNRRDNAVKEREGNQGHRDTSKRAPTIERGIPAMPSGLSKEAQKEWKAIIPLLLGNCVQLTKADGKALAAYCSCYAQWMLAEKEIQEYGITIRTVHKGDDGELLFEDYKVNPAVRVRSDALRQMKSFLLEFGLTPASRCKLETDPEGGAGSDPVSDFLNGKSRGETVM